MKLKEYLETLDGDKIVAIGAKNGASYMYMSRADNEELIIKCFDDYRESIAARIEKYTIILTQECFAVPKSSDNERGKEKNLFAYARKIGRIVDTIDRSKLYVENFKPVLEREVVDTYYKEVDDCEAIIIEGSEMGKFWFKSEFDKKYKTE